MGAGFPLAGRRVLVTGGASGIGRRLVLGAAQRGADVAVWDLDGAAAERAAADVRGRGAVAHAWQVDVTDRAAVHAAAAEVTAAMGGVDVLVNDAGVVSGRPFLELTEAQVRRTFEVNTLAPYWVTGAFLPGMLERDMGRLVTVASAAGLVGVPRQADYAASKHAAVGFDESLRFELRRAGSAVTTLVVCPFYVDTGMFAGARTRVPWLLPILREADVAGRILDAVESGRGRLALPAVVAVVPALRLLPTRAFDALMDLLGVTGSMDEFTGRRARR
ncbi:3-phenylpropionate-dihydrodiol/cinnamic acid-dihydrodiol dehydrogenase [Cellulomonas sp. T2.31MG-18]|uniref:SDR family oxidoreductase n=1 Tax=Cellulomonas sp. T2.31MG-18 TaxID=3157619 RepID=UPI0035E559F2